MAVFRKSSLLKLIAASFVILGASGGLAKAQDSGGEAVLLQPCIDNIAAYSEWADRFMTGADAFVADYSVNGQSLAIPIRNVLVSQPNQLAAVSGSLAKLDPTSDAARQMVIGMGQAAAMCAARQPDVSLAIQEEVAGIENEALQLAFAAVTGNVETAALGNGPGAAGGGGVSASGPSISGGNSDGTSGSAGDSNPDPVAQTAETFNQGGGNVLTIDENGGYRFTVVTNITIVNPTVVSPTTQ